MFVEYRPTVNLLDVESSNLWLRRLWAQLREGLGMGMQYSPRRHGPSQTVFIGFISLNVRAESLLASGIGSPIQISYRYERAGVIKSLEFEIPEAWEACFSLDEIANDLIQACVGAEQRQPEMRTYRIPITTPMKVMFPAISGPNFQFIGDGNRGSFELSIEGFGEIDCKDRAQKLAWEICILASAWSGHLWFVGEDERATRLVDYNTVLSLSSGGDLNAGIELLKDQDFSTIIGMLLGNDPFLSGLLKSAHLIQRSIYSASCDKDFLGDTANTLAMSALEVLSDKGSDPQTCKSCQQPQFKISSRVKEYASHSLREKHLEKWFGAHYGRRSKFLHTGAIENRFFSTGPSIPVINLGAAEGFEMPIGFSFDHILNEFVREIFRNEAKSATAK